FARSCCSRRLRSDRATGRQRMTDNPNEIRRKTREKPVDLVSRFCGAWANDLGADDLAAFFTDDAVYHNIPFEPVTGRRNIADNHPPLSRPAPPGIERIEFRVINIAASGPIVMTERVDIFTLAGSTFDLQVM